MSTLALGFSDPVTCSQQVFRAVMEAMARTGDVMRLTTTLSPPDPLGEGAGAVALTLLDFETPIWLDARLSDSPDVVRWLRFHTGAPLVAERDRAAFAFVTDARELSALGSFNLGTPEYPDRATTVVAEVAAFENGASLRLAGPGIAGTKRFAPAGLPEDFVAAWRENRALFPCGVDLLLVAGSRIAALPRSTRIEAGD